MERISGGLGGNCESIQRREDPEFSLREWGLKARMVSRDNTLSRRFSASQAVTSFREDPLHRSFRSNFTISSTASSPGFGYTLKDEIDPSTYSFTNALKALQLRSINTWEYLSPEVGMTLNSKWYEAEKYISNPLSGEVPMECLSAKTLVGSGGGGISSKRLLSNRFTMSAPLIYPSSHDSRRHFTNPPIQEKWNEEANDVDHKTRDVGTQSMVLLAPSKGGDADDDISPIVTSSSRSPPSPSASTPPIQERSMKCNLALQATINHSNSSSEDSSFNSNSKSDHHEGEVVLMKGGGGGGEETKRKGSEELQLQLDNNDGDDIDGVSRHSSSSCCFSCIRKKKGKNKADGASCLCMCMMDKQAADASCVNYYNGCLSLRNLRVRRRRTTRTGHADRDLEQAGK